MKPGQSFADLHALAAHLRGELESKKAILLYAYNGTGKTRLSMAFKDIGKQGDARDTVYFNAFTEDLFHWDNDLNGDSDRRLTLNADSRFFAGLAELEMDNRIRPLLQRYADFDFLIDTQEWVVRFTRAVDGQLIDNIKVSRGEENIFVWCFFLAIVELAMDPEIEAYKWVKYIYIDDPISSLDEHNAIAVANHLGQLLKKPENQLKTVISSHHTLFFNVMCNELGKARKYFLSKKPLDGYVLNDTGETPFFQHVAVLAELCEADRSGKLYTYHFNMLRTVLEKSASFHGFSHIATFINQDKDDPEGVLHKRVLDILSHGNYSLYEPREMQDENKEYFRKILNDFLSRYPFNPDLIPQSVEEADTP
jgi:hypothetical protein